MDLSGMDCEAEIRPHVKGTVEETMDHLNLYKYGLEDLLEENYKLFCQILMTAYPPHQNGSNGHSREQAGKVRSLAHMFLRQISTIKSHDRGKRGYFGNHKVISYHLQLTRGAQPPGQLSLYLLNDINSL